MLLVDAARACGWRRANTFRERFLATTQAADDMGLHYDERGRARVDATAVDEKVLEVAAERTARPADWRIRNLKHHGRRRPDTDAKPPSTRRRGKGTTPPTKAGESSALR